MPASSTTTSSRKPYGKHTPSQIWRTAHRDPRGRKSRVDRFRDAIRHGQVHIGEIITSGRIAEIVGTIGHGVDDFQLTIALKRAPFRLVSLPDGRYRVDLY